MTVTSQDSTSGARDTRRPTFGNSLWLIALLVVLTVLMCTSIVVGSREVDWSDIVAALGGSTDNIGQGAIAKRIPRTVLAIIVGAALGLAGAVMQGITRNQIGRAHV